MNDSRTALITGGAGFIGSHTAEELLRRGYRVRILDVLDPQVHSNPDRFPAHLDSRIECVRGDVCNRDDVSRALEGVSVVFHFAALTGVGQSMYEMRRYADVNVSGTANLLEAIVRGRLPLRRFVLASSRAVYGEGTHRCESCGPIHPLPRRRDDLERQRFDVYCGNCGAVARPVPTAENRPLLPGSIYGWTKRFQEDLCQHAALAHGVPVVVLRYFNVYGSRQSLTNPYTGIVSIFFSRLTAQQPISLYEYGAPSRDFVHVSDVVRANLLAAERDLEPGHVFNVGTGIEVSIRELARVLSVAADKEAWLLDSGEFRFGDIRACFADLETARNLLHYAPTVSLLEGMREFAAWARAEPSKDLYQRTVDELAQHHLIGGLAGRQAHESRVPS